MLHSNRAFCCALTGFLSLMAVAFPLFPKTAIAGPISLAANEVLTVDFSLPAAPSDHTSLFFNWRHTTSFTGDITLSLFEGNTLLESVTGTLNGLSSNVNTQIELYTSPVPSAASYPNSLLQAATNFPSIADGITNGRIEFSYNIATVLENDPTAYIASVQPFLTEGAFVIQTLRRIDFRGVSTIGRNIATITGVRVSEPTTLAILVLGLAGMGFMRRRRIA